MIFEQYLKFSMFIAESFQKKPKYESIKALKTLETVVIHNDSMSFYVN